MPRAVTSARAGKSGRRYRVRLPEMAVKITKPNANQSMSAISGGSRRRRCHARFTAGIAIRNQGANISGAWPR